MGRLGPTMATLVSIRIYDRIHARLDNSIDEELLDRLILSSVHDRIDDPMDQIFSPLWDRLYTVRTLRRPR